MTTRTNLKAGGKRYNHNETMKGLTLRTHVRAGRKAGGCQQENHNESLRSGLPLKSHVKASGQNLNHNESLRSGLPLKSHVKAGSIDTSPGRLAR